MFAHTDEVTGVAYPFQGGSASAGRAVSARAVVVRIVIPGG